jgi:TolB-like protein
MVHLFTPPSSKRTASNSGVSLNIGPGDEPEAEGVQNQFQRLLASKSFAQATRLREFLKYGVDAALGGVRNISEFAIGVDVFGRDITFDPRIDPIVRVHARRLRSKLALYYATEGADDLIEIHLPLRSYIPFFRRREPQSSCWKERLVPHQSGPARCCLAVFSFVNLSPEAKDDYFADGLTHEVIHSIAQLPECKVISWTAQEKRPEVQDIASQLGVDAALSGTLRKAGNRYRVSAELIGVPDHTILWSHMYDVEIDDIIATQEKIAHALSAALSNRLSFARPVVTRPPRRQRTTCI